MHVPEGWENVQLGDVISHKKGFAFQSKDYRDSGIRLVRISDTTRNGISNESAVYLSESKYEEHKDHVLLEGDILLSTVGSRPHLLDSMVGKAVRVPKEAHSSLLNQNLVKVVPNKHITHHHLYEMLKSQKFLYFISTLVRGNANQVSITLKELFMYSFLLPPLAEQKKIAEILGTWDEAIENVEKQITGAKAQKKALMQQLLSARTRFPHFTDDWQTVKLGDVGTVSSAGVDKKVVDGEVPVKLLNYLDVYRRNKLFTHEFKHEVTAPSAKVEGCSVKKGDVFFTPSSEVRDDVGHSAVSMEDMDGVVYSYHVVRLRPTVDMEPLYGAYAFKGQDFYKQMYKYADGSGQRYVVSQTSFRKCEIKFPTLPEQKAIAQVLDAADAEISNLQAQLEKLKTQKKGLMQQLLTGKTRVKADKEAA